MDFENIIENFKQKLRKKLRRVRKKRVAWAISLPFCIYLLFSFMDPPSDQNAKTNPATTAEVPLGAFSIIQPTIKYGFALDTFHVVQSTIANNQYLADILLPHKVDFLTIDKIAKEFKDTFDVRNLRVDKTYTILSRDTAIGADYFIYEPNVYRYVVFDLNKNQPNVEIVERPMETRVETASGIVNSSLWIAMTENGYSPDLTSRMEDALAWSIDFHHIQKGDRFKLIYERNYIDDQPVGVGQINAAYYENSGKGVYAIRFENEKHDGFYDLEARSMEKAFLKAPVKYSRISSRFSRSRFHPVLKRRKAHLGTDYAAPRGTPIFAVADGVVTKATRSRGNGNYVKIKHDDVYQTQYLHMQKHAKGIRPGVHVKQGETIGYVGSTGLATGPHVCFRFWKNGRQVNPLKQNLPPPDPMPEEDIPTYMAHKDSMKLKLDAIAYPAPKVEDIEVEQNADNNASDDSKQEELSSIEKTSETAPVTAANMD